MDSLQTQNEVSRASLALLFEIGRELASALDLNLVLNRVLMLSMRHVEAERGSIVVLDDSGTPVDAAFLIPGCLPDASTLELKTTFEHGLAGWVARRQQAVLVNDTSQDERWLQRPDDAEDRTGSKSALSVPVLAREKLVGVMTLVHPQPGFFSQEHLDLVQAISDQSGMAILNARLYQHTQLAYKRYLELFEDSIDPILCSDQHGWILESNRQACKMIGADSHVLRHYRVDDFFSVDWQKIQHEFHNQPESKVTTYECVLKARSCRDIPVAVYLRQLEGEKKQYQWILRDISERIDLDNLREDLIAMVYHDLRSPLSNVVSSLEVLNSMSFDDPVVRNLLKIALRSTDRIQRLTSSLLDINRLETGQKIGARHSTNIKLLVEDGLAAVEYSSQNKQLEIIVEIQRDCPGIWVDEDMIRRVIINLIENAVKFSPSKGKIWIGAKPLENSLLVWVRDSGPGISPGNQERIFEKFVRLNTQDVPRGLGLGLAYCRLAVQGHGGKIWLECQPGEGACFKFVLPISSDPLI